MPKYGSFTDSRDGNVYKTVTIGSQTWMIDNLRYQCKGAHVIDDDPTTIQKYGLLYGKAQLDSVAPEGWKVPCCDDFRKLLSESKKLPPDFTNARNLGTATSTQFDPYIDVKSKHLNNYRDKLEFYEDNLTDKGFSRFPAAGYFTEWDDGEKLTLFMDEYSLFLCTNGIVQMDQYGIVLNHSGSREYCAYSIRCMKYNSNENLESEDEDLSLDLDIAKLQKKVEQFGKFVDDAVKRGEIPQ